MFFHVIVIRPINFDLSKLGASLSCRASFSLSNRVFRAVMECRFEVPNIDTRNESKITYNVIDRKMCNASIDRMVGPGKAKVRALVQLLMLYRLRQSISISKKNRQPGWSVVSWTVS